MGKIIYLAGNGRVRFDISMVFVQAFKDHYNDVIVSFKN
jgi:hypothetical protein